MFSLLFGKNMPFFTKILMIQSRQSAGFNMVDMCMVWPRGGGIPHIIRLPSIRCGTGLKRCCWIFFKNYIYKKRIVDVVPYKHELIYIKI